MIGNEKMFNTMILVSALVLSLGAGISGQVPDQTRLAAALRTGSVSERHAVLADVLSIRPADRQVALENALLGELSDLNQRLLRGKAGDPTGKSSGALSEADNEYLFSLIQAVSQSPNRSVVIGLVPWLGTGSRAVNAVVGLGDYAVLEVARLAQGSDPGNTTVGLYVLNKMVLAQSARTLSEGSKRLILDVAEMRLSSPQSHSVLIEALELAVSTGDEQLVMRVRALSEDERAVRRLGVEGADAVDEIRKRATEVLRRSGRLAK